MSTLRVDVRDYLLAPLGCVAAAPLLPALSAFALPVCGGLLAHITYARSLGLAVAVAVAATALAGVLDPLAAIIVLPTLACVLWATQALRGLDAWKVASVLTVVSFASFVGAIAIGEALSGSSLVQAVQEEAAMAVGLFEDFFTDPELPEDVQESMTQSLQSLELVMAQAWPALNLLMAALGAFLATAAIGFVGARRGVEVRRFPALPMIDVSWHVVWPLIAGIALLTVATVTDRADVWYTALAWNLLIVSAAILFVQGMAVAEWLLRKAGLHVLLRILLYVAFFWAGVLLPLGAGLGLADLWLNMRKLPRGDTPESPVEHTTDSD